MPISVDLDGCLWDTPFFRAQVADREASAADLEQSIRALLKHATACHELATCTCCPKARGGDSETRAGGDGARGRGRRRGRGRGRGRRRGRGRGRASWGHSHPPCPFKSTAASMPCLSRPTTVRAVFQKAHRRPILVRSTSTTSVHAGSSAGQVGAVRGRAHPVRRQRAVERRHRHRYVPARSLPPTPQTSWPDPKLDPLYDRSRGGPGKVWARPQGD